MFENGIAITVKQLAMIVLVVVALLVVAVFGPNLLTDTKTNKVSMVVYASVEIAPGVNQLGDVRVEYVDPSLQANQAINDPRIAENYRIALVMSGANGYVYYDYCPFYLSILDNSTFNKEFSFKSITLNEGQYRAEISLQYINENGVWAYKDKFIMDLNTTLS